MERSETILREINEQCILQSQLISSLIRALEGIERECYYLDNNENLNRIVQDALTLARSKKAYGHDKV